MSFLRKCEVKLVVVAVGRGKFLFDLLDSCCFLGFVSYYTYMTMGVG